MIGQSRRRTAALAVVALATVGLVATAGPAISNNHSPRGTHGMQHDGEPDDRPILMEYATDTWASLEAMTDPDTGLPADNIDGDLDPASRSGYTSPTNIGASLWSTVVARDLGIINDPEAKERLTKTLGTVADLERHEDSGMFYNWYDESTGEKLYTFPDSDEQIYPFLSSVDNGWIATALVLVGNAEPELREQAEAIRSSMDFGFYYDPAEGQIRGGFWDEPPADTAAILDNYRDRGPDVWYTGHHYGTLNTEPRIASYLGIAWGQIPAEHYFKLFRTFPDTCDWNWGEQKPVGEWTTYMGVDVFEGAYQYRGMQMVPTWGGSMFEALMVDLFIPEADWGKKSWGVNHPLTVRAQIEHGLYEADYGYWGFSPSSDPAGDYREYGVDPIGMDASGYTTDQERTLVDYGWDDPECFREASEPTEYGDGVVTPHASFLALPYEKRAALKNLENIRNDFDAYGPGGFYDAIAVRSGMVAKRYLSLDQGMIMAALGNELEQDLVKKYVVPGEVTKKIRPLLKIETFNARGIVPEEAAYGQPTCDPRDEHTWVPLDEGWVTIPETDNVDYYLNDGKVESGETYRLNADGTNILTAEAHEGAWTIEEDFRQEITIEAAPDCDVLAVPVEAVFGQPVCSAHEGMPGVPADNGWVTIPETEGVDYLVNGGPAVSGETYPLNAGGTNVLTAVAQDGFKIDEDFSQDIVIDAVPDCVVVEEGADQNGIDQEGTDTDGEGTDTEGTDQKGGTDQDGTDQNGGGLAATGTSALALGAVAVLALLGGAGILRARRMAG